MLDTSYLEELRKEADQLNPGQRLNLIVPPELTFSSFRTRLFATISSWPDRKDFKIITKRNQISLMRKGSPLLEIQKQEIETEYKKFMREAKEKDHKDLETLLLNSKETENELKHHNLFALFLFLYITQPWRSK